MLVEMIFRNMMDIEDNIPDEWCTPEDGFNDEE